MRWTATLENCMLLKYPTKVPKDFPAANLERIVLMPMTKDMIFSMKGLVSHLFSFLHLFLL
jgi:hypothetical protein